MNKFTRAIILGTVAIATLASTLEIASAGDVNWRNRGWHGHQGWRYHNGPGWRHGGVAAGIIGGLAAGVIVGEALQPRVVYRERPVYVEPDVEYIGPVDGAAYPDDQDYVQPRDHRRVDQSQRDDRYQDDDQGQMDDQAQDDGYFPDRPQKQRTDRNSDVAQQGALEPWTAQWRSYCKQRFSTFNSTTGTYKGYDGKSHFCTAG